MQWHPYCGWMSKPRMIEIRLVLHMSEVGLAKDNSNDSLFEIRPLLNVLKKTLGSYLNVDSELALDDSSIACRSAYGRSLIFYNNTKPSGKYHFHIYVVCETDHYAALRFRVRTKDGSDFGDGQRDALVDRQVDAFLPEGGSAENQKEIENEESNTIQSLVLDMMKLFFMTGKVMNCDNYYTSPKTFIKL